MLLPAVFGCFPVIAHGPRVEPGFDVALVTALEAVPGVGNGGRTAFSPNVGLSLNHGWAGSHPDNGAFQLGIHVPAGILLAPVELAPWVLQGDLFYQFPASTSRPLDAGVGLHGAYRRVMPYLQVGRIGERGSGWYSTQGVLVAWSNRDFEGNRQYATGWLPTIAYQSAHQNTTTHFFAGALVGVGARNDGYEGSRSPHELIAGMIVVFHGKR